MGASDIDLEDVNNYYKTLLAELPKLDKRCRMEFANSAWTASGIDMLPSYKEALKRNYTAEAKEYDFSKGPKGINDWCSQQTHGLIPEMYEDDELFKQYSAVLLNALYFKGAWSKPFPKDKTFKGQFQNYDGTESEVNYMTAKRKTRCFVNDMYTVANLPFGNEAYIMQVLLPNEGRTIDECVASLSVEEWKGWSRSSASVKNVDLDIRMPKFKIEGEQYLSSKLEKLGMKLAFMPDADFSNMTSERQFYINEIKQKIFFSIDEDGAEAASASGNGMVGSDIAFPGEFYVTRPFLFILKEYSSDAILFMGAIKNL